MNVSFTENAWNDYLYWQKTDRKYQKKPLTQTEKHDKLTEL